MDQDKKFYQYAEGVMDGSIVSGKYVKLAVKRFYDDLKSAKYKFDFNTGHRVINFSEKLCNHWKGTMSGKPIILEPHQHFYIIQQFGWLRDDGTRRFRQSYKEVARKNGKTTEEGVKALFVISKDGGSGAQVYCGATKEDQARILVNDAGQITQYSKHLRDRFEVFKHRNMINRVVFPASASFIGALGRDSKTQDGLDPSMGIMDEYHEHKTDDLLNVIESGMASRKQPLLDIITTAGFNRFSPCYNLRRNCVDILEGRKHDDTLLSMIFTLDDEDDWEDQTMWAKANPNLGVSVRPEFLRDRFIKAKNEGGTKEVDFKTKNLNIWTDASTTWLKDEQWRECKKEMNLEDYQGRQCFGGLDLSKTRDISAFSLIFPNDDNTFDSFYWFWLPEERAQEREKLDQIPYLTWANDDHIILTEGNVIDQRHIFKTICDVCSDHQVERISYDRYSATQLIIDLEAEDISQMIPYGQGFVSMSTPTQMLEELVISKRLHNNGNPAMRWMMSNIEIVKDAAGNIKIDKAKSSEKVDGPVSLVIALGGYLHHQSEGGGSWSGEVWTL